MRERDKIMGKAEFVELMKDFYINEYVDTDEFGNRTEVIESPLEKVVVSDSINEKTNQPGYLIKRSVFDVPTKEVFVTQKYKVFSDSHILRSLKNSPYLNDVVEKSVSVKFNGNGGFVFDFDRMTSDIQVLDVVNKNGEYNKGEGYVFNRTSFGNFSKKMMVINSYDKSRAISLNTGLFRFICENGMVTLDHNFGYTSGRFKHFTWNTEIFNNGLIELINAIPNVLMDNESINRMYNVSVNDKIRKVFAEIVEDYTDKKITQVRSKPEVDMNKIEIINNVNEVVKTAIPYVENALDLQNMVSFFTNKKRFGAYQAGIVKVLENRFNKILSN